MRDRRADRAVRLVTRSLSLREKQRELSAQLPVWRAGWMNDVVIGGYIGAHWLVAYSEYPAKTAANRDGPPVIRWRQPIRSDDRRRGQEPPVRHVVIDKWLREKFIHARQQRIAAN